MLSWVVFAILILSMLILDLGVFNRRTHEPSMREALLWSGIWVTLALLFNLGIYFHLGQEKALLFLTAYLVEESLSVDNLFVFLLIFAYFRVPNILRHKILFWGILGAIVMRGLFIAAGVTLIHRFEWLVYVFGAFLIFTGVRVAWEKDRDPHLERNLLVRLFKRFLPVSTTYQADRFFVRQTVGWAATPLFLALLTVESSDVLFAVDSIPAVLAVTTDPLIVYTSNIFAILGLRSLFFVLAGFMQKFRYLNYGLSAILVFIGIKMVLSRFYKIPSAWALGIIVLILAGAVCFSLLADRQHPARPAPDA